MNTTTNIRGPMNEPLRLIRPGRVGHYPLSREIAERPCTCCAKPIGYGVPFWYADCFGTEVIHDACLRRQRYS